MLPNVTTICSQPASRTELAGGYLLQRERKRASSFGAAIGGETTRFVVIGACYKNRNSYCLESAWLLLLGTRSNYVGQKSGERTVSTRSVAGSQGNKRH